MPFSRQFRRHCFEQPTGGVQAHPVGRVGPLRQLCAWLYICTVDIYMYTRTCQNGTCTLSRVVQQGVSLKRALTCPDGANAPSSRVETPLSSVSISFYCNHREFPGMRSTTCSTQLPPRGLSTKTPPSFSFR